MSSPARWGIPTAWCLVSLMLLALMASCAINPAGSEQSASGAPDPIAGPADAWSELLSQAPYAYHTPLPPAETTDLDGVYAKVDPRAGERAGCRRCPPYPPEGGIWRLELDRGAFYVMHLRTEWNSLGSYAVAGDQIAFFNDPHCHQDVGRYFWNLENGQLVLQLIEDGCGVDLRARSLTAQPWLACLLPSEEPVITGHWPEPPGCESP